MGIKVFLAYASGTVLAGSDLSVEVWATKELAQDRCGVLIARTGQFWVFKPIELQGAVFLGAEGTEVGAP